MSIFAISTFDTDYVLVKEEECCDGEGGVDGRGSPRGVMQDVGDLQFGHGAQMEPGPVRRHCNVPRVRPAW
ncbi:MAG: hypothetical protein WDO73_33800 [Ignavibacteriota bacterium]